MSVYADWFTSANFGWFLLSAFVSTFVLVGVWAWASARDQARREARVAQHERPAADTDPPVSAARLAHPTRGDRWLWQEDPVCRRTRLDRDGDQ